MKRRWRRMAAPHEPALHPGRRVRRPGVRLLAGLLALLGTLAGSSLGADETSENVSVTWQLIAANFDHLYSDPSAVDDLKQAILQLAVQGKLVEHLSLLGDQQQPQALVPSLTEDADASLWVEIEVDAAQKSIAPGR